LLSSMQAKELRNDIMVVLQHLAHIPAAAAALANDPESLQVLLAVATTPEQQQGHGLLAAGTLTTDDLDYELKLLAWGSLSAIAAGAAAAAAGGGGRSVVGEERPEADCAESEAAAAAAAGQDVNTQEEDGGGVEGGAGVGKGLDRAAVVGLVRESGFLHVLLQYISPGELGQYTRGRWNKEQQQVLQRHALTCLCQVGGCGGSKRGRGYLPMGECRGGRKDARGRRGAGVK
jgi:hypothetical protein